MTIRGRIYALLDLSRYSHSHDMSCAFSDAYVSDSDSDFDPSTNSSLSRLAPYPGQTRPHTELYSNGYICRERERLEPSHPNRYIPRTQRPQPQRDVEPMYDVVGNSPRHEQHVRDSQQAHPRNIGPRSELERDMRPREPGLQVRNSGVEPPGRTGLRRELESDERPRERELKVCNSGLEPPRDTGLRGELEREVRPGERGLQMRNSGVEPPGRTGLRRELESDERPRERELKVCNSGLEPPRDTGLRRELESDERPRERELKVCNSGLEPPRDTGLRGELEREMQPNERALPVRNYSLEPAGGTGLTGSLEHNVNIGANDAIRHAAGRNEGVPVDNAGVHQMSELQQPEPVIQQAVTQRPSIEPESNSGINFIISSPSGVKILPVHAVLFEESDVDSDFNTAMNVINTTSNVVSTATTIYDVACCCLSLFG